MLNRAFFVFDTSGISVTPDSTTFTISGISQNFSSTALGWILVKSNALSSTSDTLSAADYDALPGFVNGESMAGNVTDYSSVATGWASSATDLDFTLTSDALSDMANNDIICFALIQLFFPHISCQV